jgi:hypothetical protein
MLCIANLGFSQSFVVPLDWYSTMKAERSMVDSLHRLHPELKSFYSWDIKDSRYSESLQDQPMSWRSGESFAYLVPIVDINPVFGFGSTSELNLSGMGGARLVSGFKNKFYFQVDGIAGIVQPLDYMQEVYGRFNVVPGYGLAQRSGPNYAFDQLGFNATWRATSFSNVTVGRGNNFIGEGYRSLFLSDFTSNYNYVKLDAHVWKIRYQVIYNDMRNPQNFPTSNRPTTTKYSTMHYLSFNVTKWWTIGAFESIVWEGRSDSISRGYDLAYLNPLIFLRPVEYGMGSSDNALMGFSSSVRPFRGLTLYGNVVIDEFLFGKFTAGIRRSLTDDSTILVGARENKQGYQLGLKYHQPFGVKNLSVLAEMNIVRPYTYAHGSRSQSYTHMSQSLAHPLGSNFVEWVAAASWQPERWNIGLRVLYHSKGYSDSTRNVGEEPMSYLPSLNDPSWAYDNKIAQGERQDVANVITDVQYVLIPRWDMRLVSSLHYRYSRGRVSSNQVFVSMGIRTCFWNSEKAF